MNVAARLKLSDKSISTLCAILVGIGTLLLYESMAPTRLSSANFGSDGGDYLTAVLINGVPHPTGYPLYILISELFQLLPVNNPVWRQAQVSILSGAITASLIFILVQILLSDTAISIRTICGLIASVSLAVSPLFWSQAVIIEVYSLNALFFTLSLIWLCLVNNRGQNKAQPDGMILTLAFVCGLGTGNHTTYFLLYPAIILAMIQLRKNGFSRKQIFICCLGWLSGLATYILLPIRVSMNPPIHWGNANTLEGFIWVITGGGYQQNLFSILPQEYVQRILSLITHFFQQFGLVGVICAVFGIIYYKKSIQLKWIWGYLFAAYALFAIGYKTNDSLVYILPAIILLAVWLGLGVQYLFSLKVKNLQVGILASIFLILYALIMIPTRYSSVDPRSGDLANYAETTLQEAGPNSEIHPSGDGETFALWYYHYGLGVRPDVKIISDGLMQYSWYQEQIKREHP